MSGGGGVFGAIVGGVAGFFIGGPVGAVIGAGIGATKVGQKVINTVLDFITQPFMPNIPELGDAGQSEAERQQGVLIQTQGSNVNIPIVYGFRKVAGTVVFSETGSSNNRYYYVAYAFSEGVVEGLHTVTIDDLDLPSEIIANLNAGQLVTVNSGKYAGRVQLRWSPGVYYQNPRTSTLGTLVKGDIFAEAPSYRSDMVFNGVSVLFARYEWKEIKTQADADANPFTGSTPVVQVTMLGKRIASLLTDQTEVTNYDQNQERYSTNPAECLLDYLRNPRYGKGLLNTDIDWTTWKAAARKCNQTVTYVASGIQGPIMTTNMVVETGNNLMSNTKLLLQNFRAYMPYVQGKYKLRIEDAGNETDILSGSALIAQTLTKDDIVSEITYSGIEKSAKYTSYSVTYVDPDQKWSNQQVVFPELESERQIYINQDGGRENPGSTTLGGITNYAIAKDFARLLFNKSRRQESCVFTATSKALELEPGDCIRIQSNLLNFGTDPWRIVSVKVNNDMTVDLGCVRNPDDIYPYVRAGEEDFVLPTYIPKGSIIYYPSSDNRIPLGLVPPIYAVFPPSTQPVTPIPTNPTPTNPNAPGGGGVGGGPGGGPIITEPTTPPTTPVPPINTPPVTPPPPPPFDAVLAFRNTVYTRNDATSGIFTVNFTQPEAAQYDYALFWWRPNQYTNWTSIRLDSKPGAGGQISTTIGPLSNLGQYEYYIRAYATDGRASTNVTRGNFRAVQSQTAVGELLGTGSGSTLAVVSAWAPPASEVPTAPVYDDNIDFLEVRPILVSGNPQNPRRLRVSMTQLLYTFTAPINPLIDGIYVYYKYRDDTYWQREHLLIPANKSLVETISWDLAGDFGSRAYPAQALNNPTAFQQYDFIVRLSYKDGTTALKQLGPGRGLVEQSGTPPFVGAYNFPVFGTEATATAPVKSQAVPQGFQLPLAAQQDPTLVYNTGQDLLPNFYRIRTNSQESRIQWFFNPPTNNKFRGYRIRYRPVIPGADPDFITVDVPTTVGQDGYIYFELNSNYSHSTRYEWMITALYRDNNGNTVDANNCFYARAAIPFGIASGTELLNNYFNFETKDSKTTLGEITAAFPAVAAIVPQKWIKKQLARFVSTDSSFISGDSATRRGGHEIRRDTTGQPRLNSWFELTFQAPNQTFTSLIIYRRVFATSGATRTTTGQFAKYYDLGAWERVVVPRANLTHQGSGVYVVNVRGPISHYAFNNQPTGSLFRPIYGPTGSYPGAGYPSGTQLSQMYPYFGTGNGNINYTAEYLFVLNDGGEGTRACRLTDFYTDVAGQTAVGFKSDVDGIQSANIPRDDYKNISDYNSFDAGFRRNINEALTFNNGNIAVQQLTTSDFANGAPRLNTAGNAYTFYLENPTGVTVY